MKVVDGPHGRKRYLESRIVYAAVHGWDSIEGKLIEHACDNPQCVRYSHLRLGSYGTNVLDAVLKGRHGNTKKTHCQRGHPYDDENTQVNILGRRQCRACRRITYREGRARGV